MNAEKSEIARFAERLREAAKLAGHISTRSRTRVDLSAMSKAAGCSFELARRYAEGLAMPKPSVVKALADWLGVSLSWLYYGEGPMQSAPLNLCLLESCITSAEEAQKIAGLRLSPQRLATLVAELYRDALVGVAPSARSVSAAIKALGDDGA